MPAGANEDFRGEGRNLSEKNGGLNLSICGNTTETLNIINFNQMQKLILFIALTLTLANADD